MSIINRIKQEEGYRKYPYHCSENKLSIGYGTNLEEGLSKDEASYLLKSRLYKALYNLNDKKSFHKLNYSRLPYGAREALADMMYQLGLPRFKKFAKMIKALEERDYKTASEECLDSLYHKQTKNRCERNAKLLKKCK
jgi:lysozyme